MFIGYQRMVLGERTDYKETQRIILKRWNIFYTLITIVFIQLQTFFKLTDLYISFRYIIH